MQEYRTEQTLESLRNLTAPTATACRAAAVQYSSYALMMLVRLDPLDADTLDSLRAQALSDMKSGELQDSLQSYGAQLPHALDSAAMKKMPASKIKNEQ